MASRLTGGAGLDKAGASAPASLLDLASLATQRLKQLVNELGMRRAVPYGVSFTRCVNIVSAVEMAMALIRRGMRYVLVVTADCMAPGLTRIVEPGIGVVSDVASSFVVSAEPTDGAAFAIRSVFRSVDWALADIAAQDNVPEFLRRTTAGMKAVAQGIYEKEASGPADYAQLITNTVNRSVLRIFSNATGIPAGRSSRTTSVRSGIATSPISS